LKPNEKAIDNGEPKGLTRRPCKALQATLNSFRASLSISPPHGLTEAWRGLVELYPTFPGYIRHTIMYYTAIYYILKWTVYDLLIRSLLGPLAGPFTLLEFLNDLIYGGGSLVIDHLLLKPNKKPIDKKVQGLHQTWL